VRLDQADKGILHAWVRVFVTAKAYLHLRRCPFGQHLALGHNHQPVAVIGLVHEVGGHQHRDARLGECVDALPELAARQRVDPRGRLVQEQDVRLVHERRCHRQALLESQRQVTAVVTGMLPEFEGLQRPVNAPPAPRPVETVGTGEKAQVLQHAEIRVKGKTLCHVAQPRARLGRGMAQVEPGHLYLSGRHRQQPAEHAKGGGLAGAIGAQQTEDLALLHAEADALNRIEIPEAALQVADLDYCALPGGSRWRLPRCRHRGLTGHRRVLEPGDEGILEHRFGRLRLQFAGLPRDCRQVRQSGIHRDDAHLFALDNGVDDARHGTEACLQGTFCQPGRRDEEGAPTHRRAEACRAALAKALSGMHQDHLVTALRLVEIGRAQQHAHALLLHLPVDDGPKLAAGYRVDTHRRLIQQQQARRAHQRAGQPELLLHAARQAAGQAARERGQTGHVHQFPVARAAPGMRHTLQVRIQVQVLLHAQVFIQAKPLRHVTDRGLHLERLRDNIDVQCANLPRVRKQQSRRQPHKCSLAGAVGSDEPGDLARADADVDGLQRPDGPTAGRKGLADALADEGRSDSHINRPPGTRNYWRARVPASAGRAGWTPWPASPGAVHPAGCKHAPAPDR
jgi:hypothetical protein